MRILVNALSVTNLSGRHVLLGHFSRLAKWTREEHQYDVLFHSLNKDICRNLGVNVSWHQCPAFTSGWQGRAAWEMIGLPRVAAKLKSDFMFTPAGTLVPGLRLPQVVFAQNPWALVKGLTRTWPEEKKAALQRRNYRMAMQKAAFMIFNSEYMRHAYQQNAGTLERASEVVHQALDDETHEIAAQMQLNVLRKPLQILCVSAMAPHKNVETTVSALALLRNEYKISARLVLAGAWPDSEYRQKIEKLIESQDLRDAVDIEGHVSRERLYQLYAESKVFCLMSLCESFGIPAVEAQAFGTPVVSSNCCAIPEVCGEGGYYSDPADASATADCLAQLLEDQSAWSELSQKAISNASRYRWDRCSLGMLKMFDHM